MSHELHFSPGVSGLAIADLGLRPYLGTLPISAAGITLTPLATGTDYLISNLPSTADAGDVTLTAEYPTGVWHAWRFGSRTTHNAQLVIPIRESGHTLSSLGIKVFRDGVAYTSGLAVVEIGSPGDYSLSGWPASPLGERWYVRWEYAGITFAHQWTSDGLGVGAVVGGTRYLWILAVQRPFPVGVDENDRMRFSVNFEATAAAPVVDWEKEIVKLLSDVALATLGVDTYIGQAAVLPLPPAAGPYLSVIDTGGSAPWEAQSGEEYERLSVQIIIRAATYAVARTRALAVWRRLNGLRNVTVAA